MRPIKLPTKKIATNNTVPVQKSLSEGLQLLVSQLESRRTKENSHNIDQILARIKEGRYDYQFGSGVNREILINDLKYTGLKDLALLASGGHYDESIFEKK